MARIARYAWRRGRRAGVLTGAVLRTAIRLTLIVAGLGWLDYAAWGWDYRAGAAAIGVSCLVLDAVIKSAGNSP